MLPARSHHDNIRARSCASALLGVLLLALPALGAPPQQNDAVRLDNTYFDWKDIKEEVATFEWSVDVFNNTDQELRLRIVLDLLDDDDKPINRDEQGNPIDVRVITVPPRQAMAVRQEGGIGYDRAAEVVTYRHRWEIIRGGQG